VEILLEGKLKREQGDKGSSPTREKSGVQKGQKLRHRTDTIREGF